MSDTGWDPIAEIDLLSGRRLPSPQSKPLVSVEVELWGGPRDGETIRVVDVGSELVLAFRYNADAKEEQIVYRRRPLGLEESTPDRIVFDFQPALGV